MNKITKLFLLLSVLISQPLLAQEEEDSSYFTANDTLELYSESFAGLSILEDKVQGKKVFITGENHTFTESNARLWLKMIKFLHQKAGVRNVMFEYGYSYGWLVNEYLQTGDTVLYNSIKRFAYKEYSEAIKDLHEFNMSLDSSERIYLCAIDIERGVYPIAKLLDYLLPKEYVAHDSIALHLQSINSLARYNDVKLEEQSDDDLRFTNFAYKSNPTLELVQDNFKRWEAEYEKVLGDHFETFKKVITEKFDARNLWYKYENDGAVQQYIYRENYMHERFLEEAKSRNGAWFGQFGRCHTTKTKQNSNSCDWFMFNSLANRIKYTNGGRYADSVMTIGIMYESDREMGAERSDYEEYFDPYFADVEEKSIVLFDFASDSLLDSVYGNDFDYLFLNTNTKKGEVYESIMELYEDDFDFGVSAKVIAELNLETINLGNLNNALMDAGFGDQFQTPLVSYGVNVLFGVKDDGGIPFYAGYDLGLFRGGDVMGTDISYELRGFYIKDIFYWNLIPKTKFIDIMPGFAIGYEQLKLIAEETSNTSNDLQNGYLGSVKSTSYVNPAITADVLLAADINLGFLTVGYKMAYGFDLSKTEWRTNGRIINDSPATSLSGLSQTLRFGFFF